MLPDMAIEPRDLSMAIWTACSLVILAFWEPVREVSIEDRGVWAGVEAAEADWFLEDLKKDMVA